MAAAATQLEGSPFIWDSFSMNVSWHFRQVRGRSRASAVDRCLSLIIFCGCLVQSRCNHQKQVLTCGVFITRTKTS